MCPGSLAVPRFGSDKTYAIVDEKKIEILNDAGEMVDELYFEKQ